MRFKIFNFLLILIYFNDVNAFYYNDTPFIENIKKNDIYYRNYYDPVFNQTIYLIQFLSKNNEINSQCRSSLIRWINGINENELWALKFLEATGKTINGKLTGRDVNFGAFDHCIEFTKNLEENIDFDGKYCLVSVHGKETEIIKNLDNYKTYQKSLNEISRRTIEFNIGNNHGVCMPSTCSIDEITSVTNKLIKPYGLSILSPRRCTTISEPEPLTKLQIFSFIILSIFIIFSILSIFIKNDFISKFSLADSCKVIYHHNSHDNDEYKLFLHNIKFALVIVSISSHTMILLGIYFNAPYAVVKEIKFSKMMELFLSRIYLLSDTMFFMGGFFTMYAWYDVVKSSKMKYNFFNFFVLRYVKVVVIQTVIVLITIVLPHLGTGPLYSDITNHLSYNCQQGFWRILTLTSNEQRLMDMCIIPSWYLSADFQIYILNYFVIYYLIKKPKIGIPLAFGQMFVVSLFTSFYVYHYNLKTIFNNLDVLSYDLSVFEDIYFSFFFHYNGYSIGLICAFLVKNKIKPKILDYKSVRIFITIFSYSSFYVLLIYLDYAYKNKIEHNKYLTFFWPSIDKLWNIIGPFWTFYSVLIGYSVPLRKLMQFKFSIPWSRLNFSLITSQFTYLIYLLATSRNVFTYNPMSSIKEMVAAYIFVFLLSNFIFFFYEQPIHNILKSILGIKRRSEALANGVSNNHKIELKKTNNVPNGHRELTNNNVSSNTQELKKDI